MKLPPGGITAVCVLLLASHLASELLAIYSPSPVGWNANCVHALTWSSAPDEAKTVES